MNHYRNFTTGARGMAQCTNVKSRSRVPRTHLKARVVMVTPVLWRQRQGITRESWLARLANWWALCSTERPCVNRLSVIKEDTQCQLWAYTCTRTCAREPTHMQPLINTCMQPTHLKTYKQKKLHFNYIIFRLETILKNT